MNKLIFGVIAGIAAGAALSAAVGIVFGTFVLAQYLGGSPQLGVVMGVIATWSLLFGVVAPYANELAK